MCDNIHVGGIGKMSVLVKKIGNKEYAYTAYRIGKKVVHKYIGPVSDKEVMSKIDELKSKNNIPPQYAVFFWDADPQKVNIKSNSRYIIERILEIGDMNALGWIQSIYPTRMIVEVVLESSRKISSKSKNFWKVWYGV
jgi:hypothetical protein